MSSYAAHTKFYFKLASQMRLFCPFIAYPGLRRSSLPGVIHPLADPFREITKQQNGAV